MHNLPHRAQNGGVAVWCHRGCGRWKLLHHEPFKLQSDVRCSIKIKISSGGDCIQGLRRSMIMIDNIVVTAQRKSGQLFVQAQSATN
jgi:hypothetical protein